MGTCVAVVADSLVAEKSSVYPSVPCGSRFFVCDLELQLSMSALARSRYQTTIVTSENTKIIVEIALISGVIPRRKRPQISKGSVLSRPIRKKLTAISSIDSVKINSAAPIIGSFRFGSVTRQNVCQ